MAKNIVIAVLVFVCLVVAVYAYIQVGIAQVNAKMTSENMVSAMQCQLEAAKLKEQIAIREQELAARNKQLQLALAEAVAAREKAISLRK